MSVENTNSKLKFSLIFFFGFVIFALSIGGYLAYLIKDQQERDAYYQQQTENEAQGKVTFAGPYCFPDKHPTFLLINILLIGMLGVSLLFPKLIWLSILLNGFSISRFVYWYFDTQRLLSTNETHNVKDLDSIIYKANEFDVLVLFLLSILLFWQISILLRMLIKTVQRKNGLL